MKKSIFAWIVIIFLSWLALAWMCEAAFWNQSHPQKPGRQPQSKNSYKINKLDAWCMAQTYVENRLRSPGSAKWGGTYSRCTAYLGNHRYVVTSYVDSQNGFGALIRTHFTCIVKNITGERWQLESLSMF